MHKFKDGDSIRYFWGWGRLETSNNRKYRHCGIHLNRHERDMTFSVSIPYIFSFYFTLSVFSYTSKYYETGVSVHGGTIWLSLLKDPMSWPSHGWELNIHVDNLLLGRSVCMKELIEEHAVLVPMPEKAYPATAKLIEYRWKRPRWFEKKMLRCEIDVPEGIPHEGKGENSYDCGVDRTYGMTTGESRSIAHGVGQLVGSVLHDRVRHGGWGDWKWSKPTE